MPKPLPKEYSWLVGLGPAAPNIVEEWIKIYGVEETPGSRSTPEIMAWAKELGSWYNDDIIPWCGLAQGIVCKRAGYEPPKEYLRALSWNDFGTQVHVPMLGDILTFKRPGGGHVGTYIGEDYRSYFILNGNASNRVGINIKDKMGLQQARRPIWKIGQPQSVQRYWLTTSGQLANSEE